MRENNIKKPGNNDCRKHRTHYLLLILCCCYGALTPHNVRAEPYATTGPESEGPRLDVDIEHVDINPDDLPLPLRAAGRRVFSTPFNKADGHGDGPVDPYQPWLPGGRPTLQGNGTFLRLNGLDSQTCLECHSILSNRPIPATFGVGGAGSGSSNAFPGVLDPDLDDSDGRGYARIGGRMINPLALFGVGGVALLGKEMTEDLQALREQALANPRRKVHLISKGVSFGRLRCYRNGTCDTSEVEGIDDDLVVRPFGRKGEFTSTRAFDQDAMQFHLGIQPVEIVGEGTDPDGDGVTDEIGIGPMSVLEIFLNSLERPIMAPRTRQAEQGMRIFERIGCSDCHIPFLTTRASHLNLSFPEIAEDPSANHYYAINLRDSPTNFEASGDGIIVPLFADLKRHDMGPELAESTGGELDPLFTTAKLWGVADTAPYLHDGRALTLSAAIKLHGGEARKAAKAFAKLKKERQRALLAFLGTLRNPDSVGADLDAFDATQNE